MVLQSLQKPVELLLVTLDSVRRSFPPSRETFSQSVNFGWTGGVSAMWRSLQKRWFAQEDWEGLLYSCATIVSVDGENYVWDCMNQELKGVVETTKCPTSVINHCQIVVSKTPYMDLICKVLKHSSIGLHHAIELKQ